MDSYGEGMGSCIAKGVVHGYGDWVGSDSEGSSIGEDAVVVDGKVGCVINPKMV